MDCPLRSAVSPALKWFTVRSLTLSSANFSVGWGCVSWQQIKNTSVTSIMYSTAINRQVTSLKNEIRFVLTNLSAIKLYWVTSISLTVINSFSYLSGVEIRITVAAQHRLLVSSEHCENFVNSNYTLYIKQGSPCLALLCWWLLRPASSKIDGR